MFEKNVFNVYFHFINVPSANMEEAGFMTWTAANHQGAIKMVWLQFLEPSCRPSLFTLDDLLSMS